MRSLPSDWSQPEESLGSHTSITHGISGLSTMEIPKTDVDLCGAGEKIVEVELTATSAVNGAELSHTRSDCPSLDTAHTFAIDKAMEIINNPEFSTLPLVVDVDIRIMKPGIHLVHTAVVFRLWAKTHPPEKDGGVAELALQLRWSLSGTHGGNVTVSASPNSTDLRYGDGIWSLFDLILKSEEEEYISPSTPFILSLDNVRFLKMSSVINVIGQRKGSVAMVRVNGCVFEHLSSNSATIDVHQIESGYGVDLIVQDSTFEKCQNRGIRFLGNAGSISLINVTMSHNILNVKPGHTAGGAAMYVRDSPMIYLRSCRFEGNIANGTEEISGGAISIALDEMPNSYSIAKSSNFLNVSADTHTEQHLNSPSDYFIMEGCTVLNNIIHSTGPNARGAGVAVFIEGAREYLRIADCDISDNIIDGPEKAWGSGIALINIASLEIMELINSTFTNNTIRSTQLGYGGGMDIYSIGAIDVVRIMNCSISGNTIIKQSQEAMGGGISIRNGGTLNWIAIIMSSITNNILQSGNRLGQGGGVSILALPSTEGTRIGNIIIHQSQIRENIIRTVATGSGGGIGIKLDSQIGNIVFSECVISRNSVLLEEEKVSKSFEPRTPFCQGGGVSLTFVNKVHFERCIVKDNRVVAIDPNFITCGEGGGLAVFGATNIVMSGSDNSIWKRNEAQHLGGAMWIQSVSSLKILDGADFIENRAIFGAARGGALFIRAVAYMNLSSSRFVRNRATGFGGAVAMEYVFSDAQQDPSGFLMSCQFIDNKSGGGGALHTFGRNTLMIHECVFLNNTATGEAEGSGGGALMLQGESKRLRMFEDRTTMDIHGIDILNSRFIGNSAKVGQGGAILSAEKSVWILVKDCCFDHNNAHLHGGSLEISSNSASLQSLIIMRSVSRMGNGGCMSLSGTITIMRNISMEHCSAEEGGGGALHVYQRDTNVSPTVVLDIRVRNSIAGKGDGGGILCTQKATCDFHGYDANVLLHLEGNRALDNGTGGGFACTDGARCSIVIPPSSNMTVTGNSAVHGGGISVRNAQMDIIVHGDSEGSGGLVSICDNVAESDGGALYIHETGTAFSLENGNNRSSFSIRAASGTIATDDVPQIVISRNHAAFGGAMMLYTVRDARWLIGDSSSIGATWRGSVDIDSTVCRICDNYAIRAGGAFFIASPPNTQENGGALLLPESWWKGPSAPLHGNSISSDGYGPVVATNPISIHAQWWKVEITNIDKVIKVIEAPDDQRPMGAPAGSRMWVNVTIHDAFGNIVRGYPRRSISANQASSSPYQAHHPLINVQIEPRDTASEGSTDNPLKLQFFEYGTAVNDSYSGLCNGVPMYLLPSADGKGVFAMCDGDNVTLRFEMLSSEPVHRRPSRVEPTLGTHLTVLTMTTGDNCPSNLESVSYANSSISLPMEPIPCDHRNGMAAYKIDELWICRASSCVWFPDSQQFKNWTLAFWMILLIISAVAVVTNFASMVFVFNRRLRGMIRSWLVRTGISTCLILKATAMVAISFTAIFTSILTSPDVLFSTGERHDRLQWVFIEGESVQSVFAVLVEIFLGLALVMRLLSTFWFTMLLLELSSRGYRFLNLSISARMMKRGWTKKGNELSPSNRQYCETLLSFFSVRTVLHIGIATIAILVIAVVFVIGGLLHRDDMHNGWLVAAVELFNVSVPIIALVIYLIELLYDHDGLWMLHAEIRDMKPRDVWRYRMKRAVGVVVCWLVLTIAESLSLSIVFGGAPSAQLCRPVLMPLLLIPVHIAHGFFVPLILNILPSMPSRSLRHGKGGRSNASWDRLLDDDSLENIDLADVLSQNMIIPSDQLEFSEQIGSGAQGAVFRGRLLSSGGAPVAIKSVRKTNLSNTASIELVGFYRELLTLYDNGNHPNIVRLMGVCEDENKISLVLELCEGGSLADLLKRNAAARRSGSRPIFCFTRKLRIILDVAYGMCHLHAHELIHRDLKPENVLLSDKQSIGTAKVADLGAAKMNIQDSAGNMTMNVGTAAYVAPEVLKGSTLSHSSGHNSGGVSLYDERCDVYSFGILMYAVLGDLVHPYGERKSDLDIVVNMTRDPVKFRPPHDEKQVDFIAECIENNNRWYVDLMLQCWQFDPAQRPSFTEVAKRISAHVDQS